ncbi:hypothetical protein GTO36_06320 [bacterium]|nr:hypothetical protein [bacterium]
MHKIFGIVASLLRNKEKMLISFLVILIVASFGYGFEMPVPSDYAEGSYHCLEKDSGTERWRVDWRMEKVQKDRKIVLEIKEHGYGVYGNREEKISWYMETFLEYGDSLQTIRSRKEIKNIDGEAIEVVSKKFDVEQGVVEFERKDLISGKVYGDSFEPGSTVIGPDNIALALEGTDLAEGYKTEFYLCTDEPKLYEVTAKCSRKEKIVVAGKEVESYRVEIIFHLGLWKIFVPKMYFWYTADESHRWIRYEGLESGRGTPQVVMEILDFQ